MADIQVIAGGRAREESLRRRAQELLRLADVEIDGARDWDFRVRDNRVFRRIFAQGSLGLGEAYMDGMWYAPRLDEFFHRVIRAHLDRHLVSLRLLLPYLKATLLNLQSLSRAFQVGQVHYDLSNSFFRDMLDERMIYTCAYWAAGAGTLEEAQEAKLDLVCRKIGLKPGDRVLDIGCGWGGFARYAAERYGARITGITISRKQAELGRELCRGLPVELRLQDYRQVTGEFDHIVSLGMFEHVGRKNLQTYFGVARRCLRAGGLFLLHTIGARTTQRLTDPWIVKYIFPNGDLPSLQQIATAVEDTFVIEDVHNFGADYDRTLMCWFDNFDRAWHRHRGRYGQRFYRMWEYYLKACAGAFRARDLQLWQLVLSPEGVPGGYRRSPV